MALHNPLKNMVMMILPLFFSDDPVKVNDIFQSLKTISDIEYIGQSPYLLCFSISQPEPHTNGCSLWSECS